MNQITKKLATFVMVLMAMFVLATPVFAAESTDTSEGTTIETTEDTQDTTTNAKAFAAAIAVGLAAAAGAISMGIAIAKSSESIARQPEAEGKIRGSLMLGLVFIETAIIYALIVGILIIFVL